MALPICNLDYYFTWPHIYLLDVRFGLHVLVLRDVGRRLADNVYPLDDGALAREHILARAGALCVDSVEG